MQHLSISGLLILVASFFSAIFVFIRGPKSSIGFTWSLFSLSVGLWGLGLFKGYITDIESEALFWARFLNLSAIFIPVFFLHFVVSFTNRLTEKKQAFLRCYLFSVIYFLAVVIFPETFVSGVKPALSFKYYSAPGFLYYLFPIFFAYFVIWGIVLLFKEFVQSSGLRKNQIKYLFAGILVGFAGGSTTFFPVFNINIYPFGTYLVPFYVLTVAYAIVRYRLLDINLAITRAGIFAFVYAFVLGTPFLIVRMLKPQLSGVSGEGWWLAILGLGMLLASAGPFIYLKLKTKAEAALLREERERHQALARVSQNILRFNRLDALLRAITHNLIRILQVELSAIYLFDEEKKSYCLKSAWQPPIKTPQLPAEFSPDSVLIKRLTRQNNTPLNLEEVKFRTQPGNILGVFELKQAFVSLKAQLIIPALRSGELIGFLVLGNKRSERGYSQEDIDVLMILTNHATLAIENAVFTATEKERQAVLFHSASLASLGTMASMMGHQVNNRFQAINNLTGFKEIVEMTLEGKNGLSSEEYRKLIQQLSSILSRISEEATRGGEVVASLRRLTKLSTEEFKPVHIKEVVGIALGVLQYKIPLDQIKLNMETPDTLPLILADPAQLGEVALNFIDNGYDAANERKSSQPNHEIALSIKAYITKDPGYLTVEFSDNGMGIKPENLNKLFVLFFTTKASSGKGTGLGLYVIKRVIEAHHGKISVKSKYGEGTTFTIELPRAQDEQIKAYEERMKK